MNLSAALRHLFSALEHCANACARTRELVKRAIARYIDVAASWTHAGQVARKAAA